MNDQFLEEDPCFIDSMKSKLGIDDPFPQELIDEISEIVDEMTQTVRSEE